MLIYEICLLMIEYKIWMRAEWICSEFNELADHLSRFRINSFKNTCNFYNMNIDKFPSKVEYFNDFKFMSNKFDSYMADMEEYRLFIKWLQIPMNQRHKYKYTW